MFSKECQHERVHFANHLCFVGAKHVVICMCEFLIDRARGLAIAAVMRRPADGASGRRRESAFDTDPENA